MIIFLLVGVVVGAAAVVFALQNITTITVVFLAWHLEGSLALVLVLAVLAGVIISSMFSLPGTIRRSLQISSLRKQNNKLNEEMFNLKNELGAEKAQAHVKNTPIISSEKTV